VANEILKMWKRLFAVERQARTYEELHLLRQAKSRLIIDKMLKWLYEKYPESRPESLLRKAIQYCLNHWRELTKFLDHPEIPLTNNEAERAIRIAVLGRKNFYGSRSINGADLAATMYSVIESCKKVELDVRDYLQITIRLAAEGSPTETPFEMAKRIRQAPA
jgi:transposase